MLGKLAKLGLPIVFSIALVPVVGRAQTTNATITGVVTDPTGAVVPNVQLTLTSVATGGVAKATTGPDGYYTFPNLHSGAYELKATAPGFRDYVQSGITVYINTVARVDVGLELGAAVQTVEVSANATLLSTETPTRQEGITPETIQELPLIVSERPRSAASFAILMPGVSTGGTANPFDSRINGGLQSGDEAIVDGVSMQQGLMSQTGMISIFQDFAYSPDMVSEVKLLTANYEPQYGSTTSSQIIANTRSGTNEYHATAYWYHRNTVLNAREWGSENRGKNLQNDFGASIGGPAKHVPLLWAGRRRTYFFVNFEGYRIAGGSTRPVITLPTAQERNGDFSDWVDSSGKLIPIYDPTTSVYDANGNLIGRQQFMGCDGQHPNVICTSGSNTSPLWQSMQPVAQQWLQFLPQPNRPGIKNNYQVPQAIPDVLLGHTNDWLIKGDMNWRDTDTFFVSIRYQGAAPLFNSVLSLQLAPENFTQPQYAFVDRGGWDHTFSPTLLNSMRLGYLDRNEGYGAIDTKFADKLPQIPGVSTHAYPPQIDFAEYQNWGSNTGSNLTQRTERPSKIINDLLTWVKGRHTLKFGGEVRWLGENNRDQSNGSGTFNFSAAETGVKGIQSGNSFAGFLLGAVDNANVTYHAIGSWYPRARAYIAHVGDTFKLTPKLTLSYGVRYDNFTPSWEKYDQFSFFDPLGRNPAAGNRLGRLAFAGTKWGAASFGSRYPEQHWNRGFAPRVGFAYSLNSKTVVRSGYGIFYTQAFYPGWGGGISTDGFSKTDTRGSLNGFTPSFFLFDSAGFLAPYPAPFNTAYAPVIPPIIDRGAQNGSGLNYRPFDANRLSNSQQWNLTIEHQFTNNFYISTAYVGNKGTRLPSSAVPLNALDPRLLPVYAFTNAHGRPDSHLNDVIPDDTTVIDGVQSPYPGWVAQLTNAGCSATVGQALLPYPQYCDQLRGSNENAGNSTYHSFQFKAEKRFSQGTFLLASYTLSKLITESDQVDQPAGALDWSGAHGVISPFERKRNKGLAVDDVPQVFSLAFVYSLPFGQGKRWASSSRLLDKVVGGWEATGTLRWSSGIPFFFRSGDCAVPGYLRVGCIPAILPGKNPFAQSKSNFDPNKPLFNVNAFERYQLDATGNPVKDVDGNPVTRFGNYYGVGPRISNLRGFPYHNQDLALIKETKITEKLRWQLGFEAFNLWNWHIFNSSGEFGFGAFDTDLASGTFGMWNGSITAPRVIQVRTRLSW